MSDLFSLPFEEDRTPHAAPAPQRRVVTVSELTASIRGLLETGFGDIWVDGEMSNCRLWNTGHLYFTLKDGGAQIKAVMFRSAVRYLKFKPEDGLHVIARGHFSHDESGDVFAKTTLAWGAEDDRDREWAGVVHRAFSLQYGSVSRRSPGVTHRV